MTQALKVSTTLLLLITLISAQPQTRSAPSSQLAFPQIQGNSSNVRLEPVGSFPPEPVLPQNTPGVFEVLDLADSYAEKGDFQRALQTRNEALEQARHSNPIDEAVALRGKGMDLFDLEKYDEAFTAAVEAVDAFGRVRDTVDQVDTLVRFASRFLKKKMNREGADELLARALKLGQAESVRPGHMHRLLRSAGTRLRAGNLAWSRKFYVAAFDIAQKFPEASEELGVISDDLANLEYETGDFAQAESRLRQNILRWNKLSDDASALLIDVNRLLQQANSKELLQVQGYRIQASDLEKRRKHFKGNLAHGHTRLGEIASQQGNSAAAHENFDTAIEILKTENPNPLIMTRAYQARATLKMEEGELSAAGDDLIEALKLSNEADAPSESTRAVTLLGKLAAQQRNFSSAQNFLQVAQAGLDLEDDDLAWAANRRILGDTYALMGDRRMAGLNLEGALSVYERYEMPLEIARVKLARGKFELNESRELDMKDLTEAREILTRLAPKSVMMAELLVSIAYTFGEQQRYEEAAPLLNEAKEILQRSASKNIALAVVEHNLMNPIRRSGKLDEAEKLAFQSWDRVRKLAHEFAGEDAGQNYSSLFASYGGSLAWLQISQKKNNDAFVTLERTRARGLFQLLAQRNDLDQKQWLAHKRALSGRYRAESDFGQAVNARLVASRSLQTMRTRNPSPAAIAVAEARLKDQNQEVLVAEATLAMSTARVDALWRGLLKNSPSDETPIELLKMQKSLPAGTVFLLFARDRDYLMVFGLRGGGSEVVEETIDIRTPLTPGASPPSGSEKPQLLGDLVPNFREALDGEPNDKDLASINAQGEALFNRLFPGRLRSLVLNAERLVISPEAVLWTLPFAALVTGRDANQQPQYLGLLKPITYTQSLSLYLRVSSEAPYLKPGQKPVALVVGDPLFDLRAAGTDARNEGSSGAQSEAVDKRETVWASLRSRNSPPAPLRYSREEAKSVSCLFGAAPLLGREANETSVRKDIEHADVIHLASHSVTRAEMPMSSGILLSPPSTDPAAGEMDNDGVLQAWEIFSQLRLRAELVVLSACDTALGRTVRGEGIVGLTRAFQYAGARSLVASQWEVGDQSTSALMLAFYEFLSAGKQKDEALRLAMAKVAGAKTTGHPHYWAAFTLTGASNNVNLRGASSTGCK